MQYPHILIRIINAITLSDNKTVEETELDKCFAYGYVRITFGSYIADYPMESQRDADY